jgi:hypothetical protein
MVKGSGRDLLECRAYDYREDKTRKVAVHWVYSKDAMFTLFQKARGSDLVMFVLLCLKREPLCRKWHVTISSYVRNLVLNHLPKPRPCAWKVVRHSAGAPHAFNPGRNNAQVRTGF